MDRSKTLLLTLALLSLAQLMIVLDFSIVNVALPSIRAQFDLTTTNLQWVVSAYALTFGGFLLLGGRLSDVFDRKKVFLTGLVLFSVASLLGGLAGSAELVFIARAAQGLGAAILSPSALSLITTTFQEGQQRNKALGVFGSMAAIGFTVGVTLGGILTELLSWHWVFFINLPIGAVAFIGGYFVIPNPSGKQQRRGFDVTGAVLVTISLLIAVYAISLLSVPGESYVQLLFLFLISMSLGVGFIFVERRASRPLVPLNIFHRANILTADIVMFLAYWSNASLIFIITLYLQELRGFSPLETGLIFVPAGLGGITGATIAPLLIKRIGFPTTILFGLLLFAVGLIGITTISQNSSILFLIAHYIVAAIGIVSTIVSLNIAGTSGIEKGRQGLAAGLLTTAQQIGAAIGVSVASVVVTAVTLSLGGSRSSTLEAFRSSLFVSLALVFVASLLALYLVRRYARDRRAESGRPG